MAYPIGLEVARDSLAQRDALPRQVVQDGHLVHGQMGSGQGRVRQGQKSQ